MGILSRIRRFFFPTLGDMAEDVTGAVAGMASDMDRKMRAQGLVPCGWCRSYTRGEGGEVQHEQGGARFCRIQCRESYEEAVRRRPVLCKYCGVTSPGDLPQCSNCGAARAPG